MLPPTTAAALAELAPFGMRLGLERMTTLLAALGHPEAGLPAVLVAGTNGKGSVSALLESFLRAARYRTGHYTSPHLEEVEERIRVNGTAITGERLGAHLERVLATAREVLEEPPTYFEALTACAFLEFAAHKLDLVVLEVGLGGRLDATNVLTPRLSVVTALGFDHAEHLGDTLAAIAREKAGVFRAEVPAVIALSPPEAEQALVACATEVGAPVVRVGREVAVEAIHRFRPFESASHPAQKVWLRSAGASGTDAFELTLAGRHQADNLATAVVAARELRRLGFERLSSRALAQGARQCRWPGRLEEVTLPTGQRLLLDGAHNAEGAAALGSHLALSELRYDLLFGVLADKPRAGMLPALAASAERITLTTVPGPRGVAAEELLPLAPPGRAVAVAEPEQALATALAGLGRERVLVICGSLYLVGTLRAALRQLYGVPAAARDLAPSEVAVTARSRAGR